MATTDKNIAPQQTDLFKFVIVRPPELISIENQSKHYISPNLGVINKEMLSKFSDSYFILSKSKKQIFELYRELNESNLLHEKIKSISELLKVEFDKIQTLFDTDFERIKTFQVREIDRLNIQYNESFNHQVSSDELENLQQEISFLKRQLEKFDNITLVDFLFLNLAKRYKENFHSHQRQPNNLELDLALIKCLNFINFLKTLNIVDFKKIEPKDIKAIHSSLKVLPILDNIYEFLAEVSIPNQNNIVRNVGKADLKVVKQKLIRYQTGEIAHIENVLKGESKERKHRQLDRTENIFTTSTETIEETTRDTQTTDRFELQKEVQKAVQEKMDITAGVTVSGKGIVEYSAHADFAYSTAKQDSEKTASTLAKEIIDKSVSRIQKTVREERTTKTIHEVEELNTHTIDNKGGDANNISGIYCWVDKVYLAELYNYGQRLMLEVSIPEPATFYRQLFDKKKEVPELLIKSKPDDLPSGFSHSSINNDNYKELSIKYQAEAIKSPLNKFTTIAGSLTFKQENHHANATNTASDKLIVPAGYTLKYVRYDFAIVHWNNAYCTILIGDHEISPNIKVDVWDNVLKVTNKSGMTIISSSDIEQSILSYEQGMVVPISIVSYDCFGASVNVVGHCEITEHEIQQWQIDTYEKIMTGYNKLLQIYEDSLNAHEVQADIQIQGQNPLINREIEKTELKRQCVEALLDNAIETKYGEFNGLKDARPPATITPRINFANSIPQNRTIQFFEQAIDWTNLTYLFYPYFWGKEERWEMLADSQDIDPIFTKFLQAGSARVSLPVTKNYEFAIQHYLATGQIWSNGELPAIGNEMYLSIADEIRRQTDENYGEPVKEGDWEIVIPTTLVYLKEDDILPDYKK